MQAAPPDAPAHEAGCCDDDALEGPVLTVLRQLGPDVWQHLGPTSRHALRAGCRAMLELSDQRCTQGLTVVGGGRSKGSGIIVARLSHGVF